MRLTRRNRIKLLLNTYIDATSPGRGDSDVRSPLGSRAPAKSYLYAQGSYHELGACLGRLERDYPRIHRHTLTVYAPELLEHTKGYVVPHPRRQLHERGWAFLDRWMPQNIYVPAEIVENEGYSPGEARAAGKPRPKVAA